MKKIKKRLVALLCCVCMLTTGNIQAEAKNAGTAISIGIDVSRWQGDINWAAVAASGVQYAFVRVGSVKYGLDVKFDQTCDHG